LLVVTDNSPLTALALADLLHLLRARWPLVIVPQAVWDESRYVGDAAALHRLDAARAEGWLEVRHALHNDEVARLRAKLDAGESEAIALALELKAEWLLIDELKGRNVAKQLGLAVTGTLGLLIWAKMSERSPSLRELIDLVESRGELYLSHELKESALAAVGE
jgi:predicted nucleic acid-binding protein